MAGCRDIAGYVSFHTVRDNARGGDVSVFIRENLSCIKISEFSLVDPTIESCMVIVEIDNSFSIFTSGIYTHSIITSKNAFRHVETLFVQGNQVRNDQNKPSFMLIKKKRTISTNLITLDE